MVVIYDVAEQRVVESVITCHAPGGRNSVSEEVRSTHEVPAALVVRNGIAAKTMVASRRDRDLSMTFRAT